MKKSSRIIRNVVVVLSILILSLIAFVGIFVEVDGVYENTVPGLNYGMELSGTRELRYLLSTAEEEKEVYVDDEGNIKGFVPEATDSAEKDQAEDLISINTTVDEDAGKDEETTDGKVAGYKTEKRVIKANPDEKTLVDFENTKKIIQTRLGKEKEIEYNIRLDTLSNNELILEVPNDEAYVDYVRFMVERKGKFELLDKDTRVVLMDNSYIKEVTAGVGNALNNDGTQRAGYSQVYLLVTLTDEGRETIKNISNEYREQLDEEGNRTNKVITLEIDGVKLLETAFTSEYNNNILQIPIGEPLNTSEDILVLLEQAEIYATVVDTGVLPLEYHLSSDNFIHSPITDDIRNIVLIVFAAVLIVFAVLFIVKFKLNGLYASLLNVGYIALVVLVIKYTSILITIPASLAIIAGIVINMVFMYMYLNRIKNDVTSKEAFKEVFKKVYVAIVPLIIIAIIFTCIGNAVVGSIGTVLFWGILIQLIYSFVAIKGSFVK